MQGLSKSRIELPETVVMEILSKLPAKSLTRFRCVCKPWCSSFQTSHFITKHQHNNLKNNNLNLLLRCYRGNTHDDIHYFSALSTEKGQNFLVKENIHLPFFENCWYAPVVSGPCNGLLCLHDAGKAALWNPSTREFKILPQSSVQRPPSVDSTSFGCLGFGFDSKTDDYKVVRFVTNYFDENEEEGFLADWNHQVELYSLKSDSWKEISVPEAQPYGSPLFNNYINGFYYWQATGDSWQATGDSDYLILSFDMANEKFSTLPLPKFGGSLAQYYLELLDFNGLLGVIVYPREGTEKSFDLWVMNGSWTRQFSIESVSGVERPLGFWKNGELFLEGSNHELMLFENFGIHAYQKTMQLIAYAESLVPINGRSEHEEHIIRQPARNAWDFFLLDIWHGNRVFI